MVSIGILRFLVENVREFILEKKLCNFNTTKKLHVLVITLNLKYLYFQLCLSVITLRINFKANMPMIS